MKFSIVKGAPIWCHQKQTQQPQFSQREAWKKPRRHRPALRLSESGRWAWMPHGSHLTTLLCFFMVDCGEVWTRCRSGRNAINILRAWSNKGEGGQIWDDHSWWEWEGYDDYDGVWAESYGPLGLEFGIWISTNPDYFVFSAVNKRRFHGSWRPSQDRRKSLQSHYVRLRTELLLQLLHFGLHLWLMKHDETIREKWILVARKAKRTSLECTLKPDCIWSMDNGFWIFSKPAPIFTL